MNLGQHSSGKLQSIRFVFQAEAFDLSGTQKTNARCLTNYSPGREHALNRNKRNELAVFTSWILSIFQQPSRSFQFFISIINL